MAGSASALAASSVSKYSPVSYTHLDVYKRQDGEQKNPFAKLGDSEIRSINCDFADVVAEDTDFFYCLLSDSSCRAVVRPEDELFTEAANVLNKNK